MASYSLSYLASDTYDSMKAANAALLAASFSVFGGGWLSGISISAGRHFTGIEDSHRIRKLMNKFSFEYLNKLPKRAERAFLPLAAAGSIALSALVYGLNGARHEQKEHFAPVLNENYDFARNHYRNEFYRR